MRRRGRIAAITLALTALLSTMLAPGVSADVFDTACASPTQTIAADSTVTLNLAATDVVLISGGTFSGGVNAFPSGAVICVGPAGTFAASYMNNAAGHLLNRGTVTMPSTGVQGGFAFDNFGTAAFPSSFNTNGTALLVNHAGGTWSMSQGFNTSSVFVNDGTATLAAGLNQNGGGVIENTGTLTITGSSNLNGSTSNTGVLTFGGPVNLNGGSRLANGCLTTVQGNLTNNQDISNSGWIRFDPGTTWTNNGSGIYDQGTDAFTSGANLTNNGTVRGHGAYRFTGNTVTQNTFSGSDPTHPIVFEDTTPSATPGQIFDTQSGTVVNVIKATVDLGRAGEVPFNCAVPPAITANVAAVQTGPATAAPGASISYEVTVTNEGPEVATGVVIVDALPATLTGVTTTGGGAVDNGAHTVTWTVGSMAPGASQSFTVTGTTPASGTLVAVVSATSTSDDPTPVDNDGSAAAAIVTTVIVAVPPPNQPPVVDDVNLAVVATTSVDGSVPMSDPDAGQQVTAVLATPPAHGVVVVRPAGTFSFEPDGAFTGVDTFVVTGCDNGTPVECDDGTVTITFTPRAGDDEASTSDGVPVSIRVSINDIGDTGPPVVTADPPNGTATVEADGTVTYTSDPGFTGVDKFDYEICSEVTPSVCDEASVTVTVDPANEAPKVGDAVVTTTATSPVSGAVSVDDPDGVVVSMIVTFGPSHGSATVAVIGAFVYTPTGGFTGVDLFVMRGCDGPLPDGLCDAGTVVVTVFPVAADDAATTTAGTPVSIDVLANDLGDTGAPVVTSPPANGTATVESDGTVTYAPTGSFAGTDAFDYEICSEQTPTVCATATVTVTIANRAPTVGDADVTTTATAPVGGSVAVTDPDPSQVVTLAISAGPAHGTATIADDGSFEYAPTGTFTGRDAFTVEACDDQEPSLCDTGTVSVTVFPVARDDAGVTTQGTPVEVDVEANDLGDTGGVEIVVEPAHGTAVTGSIVYTPDAGFIGSDEVGYRICSLVDPDVCDAATLSIQVVGGTPRPSASVPETSSLLDGLTRLPPAAMPVLVVALLALAAGFGAAAASLRRRRR